VPNIESWSCWFVSWPAAQSPDFLEEVLQVLRFSTRRNKGARIAVSWMDRDDAIEGPHRRQTRLPLERNTKENELVASSSSGAPGTTSRTFPKVPPTTAIVTLLRGVPFSVSCTWRS
jgi:hypothetical protein